VSIPLLLVCDGDEAKQTTLEGLVKSELGLKYIATVSMQEGTRAIERAVKVGAKLIWIDLDEEPVEGLNLLAEIRKLHPMLNVIVSRSQLDPDMVRAALQLGALDFLDPSRAAQQLNVVVENLKDSGVRSTVSQTALPAQAVAPQTQAASAQAQTMAPQSQSVTNPSLTTGGGNKWVDLDSIPTPGAQALPPFGQDVTGEIHVASSGIQNLVASQSAAAQAAAATARPTAELPGGASKWGDLDSIAAPAISAPAASPAPAATQSAPMTTPAPAPMSAPAPTPMSAPAPAPMPAPAPVPMPAPAPVPMPAPAPTSQAPGPASVSPPGGGPNNFNGGKWGDLDAIPTPKAEQAVAPKPTAEIVKPLSDLDAIPSPTTPTAPSVPSGLSNLSAAPMPKPEPHVNTNKALRPSPEKAELYSMGSPVMMAVVIIVVIFAAIGFMLFKQHNQPATLPTAQPTTQQTSQPSIQPPAKPTK
jgi:DNA-binding NarL/FixJ family response regulator